MIVVRKRNSWKVVLYMLAVGAFTILWFVLAKTKPPRDAFPSVLVISRSRPANYLSRVAQSRSTWAAKVPYRTDQRVIFIGGNVTDGGKDMMTSNCGDQIDYTHKVKSNEICKTLRGIAIAYHVLHYEFYDWVLVVDDDSYVLLDNIQRYLHNRPDVTAMGILGCVSKNCSGICGGGGYALAARTIKVLVEGYNATKFKDFDDEFTRKGQHCEYFDDLTMFEVMKSRKNLTTFSWQGSYAWMLEPKELNESLLNRNTKPLTYHYNTHREGMHGVHALVTAFNSCAIIPASQRKSVKTMNTVLKRYLGF